MHRPSLPNSNCGSTHAPSESWGDPDMSVLNLVRVLSPRMPLRGFGDALSNYIEIAAEAASAPADYVGLSLLIGSAGLLGARRRVEIWPGWTEPAILWGALVGDPSSNKSPAVDSIREALVAVEEEKLAEFKPRETDYLHALAVSKARTRRWDVGSGNLHMVRQRRNEGLESRGTSEIHLHASRAPAA